MSSEGERVALVTGGARGIGKAICETLLNQGFTVVCLDLETPPLELGVEWAEVDVGEAGPLAKAIRQVGKGQKRLDLLVNNAGKSVHQELADVTEADWDRSFAVNLKAAFFAAQATAPFLERSRGRIINISSELAHIGCATLPHYSAAKGGLLALTRSLARALAPAVAVNVVVPGPVETEMFRHSPQFTPKFGEILPIGRLPQPEDIALTVGFLAGPGGDVYTGQQFNANGGLVMV
jgi:NAD(P)-dependent dehydrogenase (short-subunit alcohol dehydrogenase family)